MKDFYAVSNALTAEIYTDYDMADAIADTDGGGYLTDVLDTPDGSNDVFVTVLNYIENPVSEFTRLFKTYEDGQKFIVEYLTPRINEYAALCGAETPSAMDYDSLMEIALMVDDLYIFHGEAVMAQ